MVNIEKIDWKKLKNPHPLFKTYKPDEEDPIKFYKKLERLKKHLENRYLYTSDEYRSKENIHVTVMNYFAGHTFSIFYEIGDFQGLMGFTNIIPEYKCDVTIKLWDEKIWSKEFARAAKNLIDLYMKEFKLKRMSSETADEKIIKMSEMAGFKVEGQQPYGFKWKGKFYDLYLLGKTKEK